MIEENVKLVEGNYDLKKKAKIAERKVKEAQESQKHPVKATVGVNRPQTGKKNAFEQAEMKKEI